MSDFQLFQKNYQYYLNTSDAFYIIENRSHNCVSFNLTEQTFVQADNPLADKPTMYEDNKFNMLFGVTQPLEDKGQYAILVTKSISLCKLANNYDLYKIDKIKVFKVNKVGVDQTKAMEKAFNDMLQFNNLYYSLNYDLTQNLYANITKKNIYPEHNLRKWRFVFNHNFILHPKYSSAVIHGYIDTGFSRVNDKPVNTYIISRKDCRRIGSRLWCRGAEANGNCANYVETEHITEINENVECYKIQSYIITRGSPAIIWSQKVNLSYNPPLSVTSQDINKTACFNHLEEHTKMYGNTMICNLIEKTKHYQQPVGKEWNLRVDQFAEGHSDVKNVWFDFHKECSSKNGGWAKLSKLLNMSKEYLDNNGSYVLYIRKNEVIERSVQSGVVRVNCFDSLDRTNVVQNNYCKYAVSKFLSNNLNQTDNYTGEISTIYPLPGDMEQNFRNMWTDNADALSRSYTGTGSLKTDYTRTGKRNWYGPLKDGYNSYLRYFMNNLYGSTRDNIYNEVYDGLGGFKTKKDYSSAVLIMAIVIPIIIILILSSIYFHIALNDTTIFHQIYQIYYNNKRYVLQKSRLLTKRLNTSSIIRKGWANWLGIENPIIIDIIRLLEIIFVVWLILKLLLTMLNTCFKKSVVGVRNKGD